MRKFNNTIALLLQTTFIIACMFPAFKFCWDMYVIPKWYAAMLVLLLGIVYFVLYGNSLNKSIWRGYLQISAGCGVFFQLIAVACEIIRQPHLLFDFGVSGTFNNPNSLAVVLCLLLPLAIRHLNEGQDNQRRNARKWNVCIVITSSMLIFATHSRTGLIVLVIYLLLWTYRCSRVSRNKKKAMALGLVVLSLFAVCFIKANSSKGRYLILTRSLKLISQSPWKGYGVDGFGRTYMVSQAAFFQQCAKSDYDSLADNIRHLLNEFVHLWINYGVIGPVVLFLLVILPIIVWKKDMKIVMTMTCMLIFCTFSYPLHQPLPVLVMLYLFLRTVLKYAKIRKSFLKYVCVITMIMSLPYLAGLFYIDNLMSSATFYGANGKHNRSIYKYSQLHDCFGCNFMRKFYHFRYKVFLYNYSRELYTVGNFKDALNMVCQTETFVADYDTKLLLGDTLYNLSDFESAINAYKMAHNMCPVRYAPLAGLFNCFKTKQDSIGAAIMAKEIIEKPVKIESSDITKIKDEARLYIECTKRNTCK